MTTLAIIGWIALVLFGLVVSFCLFMGYFWTSAVGDGLKFEESIFFFGLGTLMFFYWKWLYEIAPFTLTITKATGG